VKRMRAAVEALSEGRVGLGCHSSAIGALDAQWRTCENVEKIRRLRNLA